MIFDDNVNSSILPGAMWKKFLEEGSDMSQGVDKIASIDGFTPGLLSPLIDNSVGGLAGGLMSGLTSGKASTTLDSIAGTAGGMLLNNALVNEQGSAKKGLVGLLAGVGISALSDGKIGMLPAALLGAGVMTGSPLGNKDLF